MNKQIICIKARSHSDFELYLIGEKYDMPYDFLLDYKSNSKVYKFWTEVGSGKLSAIEERPNEKTRNFISYAPMSDREKQSLIDIQPIRVGTILNKFKGDINEKEKEFKEMLVAKEKHKIEMLNRDIDPSTILCINLKNTNEQLFSICVQHRVDFLEVMSFKEEYGALNLVRLWIEKETNTRVAYAFLNSPNSSKNSPWETFVEIKDSLIPKITIEQMSHKPVAIPRLKVTEESLNQYNRANKRGYISITKFEKTLFAQLVEEAGRPTEEDLEFCTMDNVSIEYLTELLNETVELENYELAALLRDHIINLKENERNKS